MHLTSLTFTAVSVEAITYFIIFRKVAQSWDLLYAKIRYFTECLPLVWLQRKFLNAAELQFS